MKGLGSVHKKFGIHLYELGVSTSKCSQAGCWALSGQKEPKLPKTLFKSQALCNLVEFEHVQKAKAKFWLLPFTLSLSLIPFFLLLLHCFLFAFVSFFFIITKLQTMQGQGVDCVQYFIPPFIIPHLTRFELRNRIKGTLTNQTRPPISHFYLCYIIKVILMVFGSTLISLLLYSSIWRIPYLWH